MTVYVLVDRVRDSLEGHTEVFATLEEAKTALAQNWPQSEGYWHNTKGTAARFIGNDGKTVQCIEILRREVRTL